MSASARPQSVAAQSKPTKRPPGIAGVPVQRRGPSKTEREIAALSVWVTSAVTCERCNKQDHTSALSDYYAAMKFYKLGWRCTNAKGSASPGILCPECVGAQPHGAATKKGGA